jgi:hypothetical protein
MAKEKTVKPKLTAKSIIVEYIAKGWKAQRIVDKVKAKLPESNADESHIKYYVRRLLKEGAINEELASKYSVKPARGAAAEKPAEKPAKPARRGKKDEKAEKPAKKARRGKKK